MGAELQCRATIDGVTCEGTALLETRELRFRGAGARVIVPFDAITSIRAREGVLEIRFAGRRADLELGDRATKWLEKVKNPPGLLDKLGIKAGMRVSVVGATPDTFLAELRGSGRTDDVTAGKPKAGSDAIFFAAEPTADLVRLAGIVEKLKRDGALWVIRPKGGKTITEAEVMAAGKAAGLVDVKVAAFSATHTAEKYVIPVSRRQAAASRR